MIATSGKHSAMVRCLSVLFLVLPLSACVPYVRAQDDKGCEGVQYSKRPPAEYSPEKLQQRIRQDPSDVDALVNLGIRREEQGHLAEAKALYERAIKAKPDCDLGYYFAGFVEEQLAGDEASDAKLNIGKALTLNPSLQHDPNVESFMKRHTPPIVSRAAAEGEPPSFSRQILAGSNWFYIGLGLGILLTSIVLYLARSRSTAPTET